MKNSHKNSHKNKNNKYNSIRSIQNEQVKKGKKRKINKKKFAKVILPGILMVLFYFAVLPLLTRLLFPFPYQDKIGEYAGQHQLDPYLVAAVVYVESGFDPTAVSPKGARGLMQIMPATGEWVAENMDKDAFNMDIDAFNEELLFDPDINLMIGTTYLAGLLKQFDGNIYLSLAAYNGGRSRVVRWLEEGIWDGEPENIDHIPFPETRNYVKKVNTAYSQYRRIYA